ncbi:MAG: hypothetical protein ACLUN6_03985 [Holdemanella sp.]|uniref:hypothetical protein n=1 Tax=Holdemanella sp. TaxID=1971762 RepID=UPI003996979B
MAATQIPGVKVVSPGTITVTVEKTVSTQGAKVQKYVKLENRQSVLALLTVEADPGANNVYTYGGERMRSRPRSTARTERMRIS